MIIGLMGFEFNSPNKGCEALGYSFLSILAEHINRRVIIYNFSGTELGNIPIFFPNFTFINIYPKIKDIQLKYIRAIKRCDYIFDVTMGDSFSDIYSIDYYKKLCRHKRIAGLLCHKYILLPQTYGPFNEKGSADHALKILQRSFKIYCRDEISKKLLQNKFNIHNAILASDMAFFLPYNKGMYQFSAERKVGLNVSGLLYKGGFNLNNQFELSINYVDLINRLLLNLHNKYEVHLIPHVIDLKEDAYDDDYKICEFLHNKFPNTTLAPQFETPIQAKSYISNMDIFIGSRMHSTIASFSSGVVTIPISYSRKFEGLFGSLEYPYVVSAKTESTQSAFEMIMKYIEEKNKLMKAQSMSLNLVKEKNSVFEKNIIEIIKEN